MHTGMSRRLFLGRAPLVVAGTAVVAASARAGVQPREEDRNERSLDPEMVFEFVSAAHDDMDKTRRMLDGEPLLIRANWEWEPGDFESGIDGAAHTGSAEIVRFLVERGAIYSIFAAATVGDLASVRAMVERFPSLVHAKGAHGIPLLDHAREAREVGAAVARFLMEREAGDGK